MIKLSKNIKHEMAKGFVQGLLKHAGYRVVPSGMEQIVREVTPLDHAQYKALELPKVLRMLPDYVVLDRSASRCHLVDVNYRSKILGGFIDDLGTKVEVLGELTLVLFNGATTASGVVQDLGEIVRCSRLRRSAAGVTISLRDSSGGIGDVALDQRLASRLWDGMQPLRFVFGDVGAVEPGLEVAMESAVRALAA